MGRTDDQPRRRSDAERNRAQILATARAMLADRDAEVSMAEVARRANVGMATLYRNFPGLRELLEALYRQEVDELCLVMQEPGNEPGDALISWLRRFAVFHSNKHPIAGQLLRHTDADNPVFGGSRDRVLAAGRPLLSAAQQAQQARNDLTLDQILDLVLAVTTIRGDRAYVQPILDAALNGLRTPHPH